MVKLRLKVGHKGQVVIPKILRDKYGIRENSYVTIEVYEDGIFIRRIPDIDEILKWLK